MKGRVVLTLEEEKGKLLASCEHTFDLDALGDTSLEMPLIIPGGAGKCILKATARSNDAREGTTSRRWVRIQPGES